ncbi:hypothetical protein E2C01_042134 [Portunus trituberculatus]|uniref:Uncharacterized protein n=1 Tax=Portunus trituberculatus TaxID=210409 RepID=A0A5B7FVM4_PORTR|nr:hypothetical protein [Portunus trituberculatus]
MKRTPTSTPYRVLAGETSQQLRSSTTLLQRCRQKSCHTPEMRRTLAHAVGISEDDDGVPVKRVLEHLTLHFQRQRNFALRRVKFEESWQQEGEFFDEVFVSLKEFADDAELCIDCVDNRLVINITSGVADQNLGQKLLAIDPPPILPVALRLCRSEESLVNMETELACTRRSIGRAARKMQRYWSASSHYQKEGNTKCVGCGGAEANVIGLRQLRRLGLSESDLSACQNEVLAANRSRLRPVGSFNATLTLGDASVDTAISISAVRSTETTRLHSNMGNSKREDRNALLEEFSDGLVDPED